jgi:TonB-dependent starch-binding outer membrane protein SusC
MKKLKTIFNWKDLYSNLGKILLVMKLTFLLILISALSVLAGKTYSQTKKLNMNMENATVKEVLSTIESQSEFYFMYSEKIIDVNRKVSVNIDDQTIETVLNKMFEGTNVEYTIKDRIIVLTTPDVFNSETQTFQQQKAVTGKVTSTSGDPLPGVSVVVKGTTTGTVTGSDGHYSLSNLPAQATLLFSFVGMKTQEINAEGKSTINVTLTEESIGLDEVVAIGYGTVKKSDLTGSVASVKASQLVEAKSSANFESLLQGRAAGVTIINSGNDNPTGGVSVRVRGLSSINGSNSPLVVVDGIPVGEAGALKNINPAVIETIEVLKDASSTAIYGSRGANGVIMVTTKRGKEGKATVFVDHKTSLGYFSDKLDYWRDPVEMMKLSNESYVNAGIQPLYIGGPNPTTGVYYPSIAEVESGAWPYHTIWEDYVFRKPSLSNETSFGVNGGNHKNRYNVNATYFKGEGMRIDDDYEKLIFDLNYETQIKDYFRLQTRTGFFLDDRNNIHPGGHMRNPLFPVFNGDGTPFKEHPTDYGNPIAQRENLSNKSKSLGGYATIQFDVDFSKDLKLVVRGDGRATFSDNSLWNPIKWSEEGNKWNNAATYGRTSQKDLTFDSYLTYTKTIAYKHNISIMAGVSSSQTLYEYLNGTGFGFNSITLAGENLGTATNISVANGETKTALLAGFTRLNYNYAGRYYLTFTARADGSSKFGENNKWANFPSAGASWRLSEEDFIKNSGIFDNLKLRASYGFSGNQGIQPYQTNTIYGWQWTGYQGKDVQAYGPGVEVGREGTGNRYPRWGGIGNKDLRWEKTSQLSVGLDVSVLSNRLNATLDVYQKKTTDLLREQFLAPNSGFDRIWTNDGEINNKGIELTLNGQVVNSKTWNLDAELIFSMNRNKVVSLGNDKSSGLMTDSNGVKFEAYGAMQGNFLESYFSILAIGQPIGVFYGYHVDGIIQQMPANPTDATMPGEFNYVGMDETGNPNPAARTIIGNPNPDFTSSFTLSLSHKSGFDLNMQWYCVYGNDIISTTKGGRTDLQKDRWTPENPSTTRPRLRSTRRTYFSDWYVEDGSFLRLQNLTIGYNVPKVPYIESCRLFITGTNLLTFTKSTQYDPEIAESGFGTAQYPRVATYSIGVQLKF